MLLEVRDAVVNYGKVAAVRGISLSVGEGGIATLIGANGAGKTTTLRAISGLEKLSAGEDHFRWRAHRRPAARRRRRKGNCACPGRPQGFPGPDRRGEIFGRARICGKTRKP